MTTARGVVLVVEDETAIADLLRMYLSREGFQVLVETDAPYLAPVPWRAFIICNPLSTCFVIVCNFADSSSSTRAA